MHFIENQPHSSPEITDSHIEPSIPEPPREQSEPQDPLHVLYGSWTNTEIEACRIFQKNSLSVIGVPTSICDPDVLAGPKYFGQYGKIISITAKVRKDKFKGNELTNY